MNSKPIEVGVDLGKASFDASIAGDCRTWPNTPSGIRRFLDHLASLNHPVRVSCEATGAYTRQLVLACLRRGIPIALLNARSVRAFARATGNVGSFLRNARDLAGSPSCLPRLVRIVA